MNPNAFPYMVVDIFAASLAAVILAVVWSRRESPGGSALALTLGAAAWWSLGHGLSLPLTTIQGKVALAWLWYLGPAIVPWSLLAFSLQFLQHRVRWPRHWEAAAAVPPALTLGFLWTNPWHHLFWTRVYIDNTAPFQLFGVDRGPAFWASFLLSDAAVSLAMALLLWVAVTNRGLYRGQVLLMVAGVAVPAITEIVYLSGHSPYQNLDFTPPSFAIGMAFIGWAVFGYRLLDVVPVAHRLVIQGIADPVIVLDRYDRLIYANQAAATLAEAEELPLGRAVGEAFPALAGLLRSGPNGDFAWTAGQSQRIFNVGLSAIRSGSSAPSGQIIVLRDVTQYRKIDSLERSRQQIIAAEEHVRRQISEMLHGTVQSKLLALWFRLGDYEERWSRSDVESAELAAIREEIERISEQDVRRASHLLHPSIIRFGLVPAIRDLADARAKSFEVELVASPALIALDSVGGAGIAEELRLVAYRVVEEALNNAAKHAKARRVTITLDANEGALQVAVGDDGEGFQLGQVRPGLGLDSIGGRIDQLHGLLRIESVPQQGTRLLVTLPLEGGPHANPPADGALMGRSHSSIVSITSKPTER